MAYPPADPANDKADATPSATDHPAHHNALANAVADIVDELGPAPKGGSANVTARLDAIDDSIEGLDGTYVSLSADQTIAGTKTFSVAPVVPDGSFSIAKTSGLQAALDAKAADSAVVKLTGDQTIAGKKRFSDILYVRATAPGTTDPIGVMMKPAGSGLDSPIEMSHEDIEGYIFHVNCRLGMGAGGGGSVPALFGLGCDFGGTGIYAHVRADGGGGWGVRIGIDPGTTLSTVGAAGLSISVPSGAMPGAYFIQSPATTAAPPAAKFWAQLAIDANQKLTEWLKPNTLSAGTSVGYVRAQDGALIWNAPTILSASAISEKPLLIQGASGQTANLTEWFTAGGPGTVASMDPSGYLVLNGGARIQAATPDFTLYQNSGGTTNQRRYRFTVTSGVLAIQARLDNGNSSADLLTITHTNGNLGLRDGAAVVTGTTTGSIIAASTSQKLGFHGATATVQRAGAAQVAVATTAATQTTPWGFSTQAQADAIVTLLNELRAANVEKGLIKGAA